MTREEYIRKTVVRILFEQEETPPTGGAPGEDPGIGEEEDWSRPKGRRSNAYIAAENLVSSNPKALFDRLGFSKVSTPPTGKMDDVRNFLQQVTMSNSDLAQVYGKVTMSGDSVIVERRRELRGRSDFYGEASGPTYVVQSAAACGRWINLLMVAAGKLGWIKFSPEKDVVMIGGTDKGFIRVIPSSYPPAEKKEATAKGPSPSKSENPPKKA